MSEANRLDSISGWKNAKTFFWWLALPGHRRESLRCIAARGSRALWDQRQCGGDLGAALETNRKLYGKAEWRQHITAGRSRRMLVLIAKQPDLTLDEIVAATEKRGIACSRTAVWRFFDRRNISFKKKRVFCKSSG